MYYQRQGQLPRKRHIAFRKPDGPLYYEEHMSRDGFSGAYSNLYHLRMPTRVTRVGTFHPLPVTTVADAHHPRHVKTSELPEDGDWVSGRRLLFFNDDVLISKVHPTQDSTTFYRNGHYDELLYIQAGSGVLETQFGTLRFKKGDYLLLPRGVIAALKLESRPARFLVIEAARQICAPRRYLNSRGQLLESSPYCERDLRQPELQWPVEQGGEHTVRVRLQTGIQDYVYDSHPFDVVGWDGTHYPWAFNINDFEPIVGSVHQPPPVHQTFESGGPGGGFVVCSFVSRPYDFHPQAVPAPYPHSNLDSDEILFYSEGEFMSRKGIFPESITYHPMGLAHGPQPGRYEESIGKKDTQELAVMIDTFRPLNVSPDAQRLEDPTYPLSWVG